MSESVDRNRLRAYTNARVALRSAGMSLATSELLDMALCLAEARDAVHTQLSTVTLVPQLASSGLEVFSVRSAAGGRGEYLRRPDLGRRLSAESRAALEGACEPTQGQNRALSGAPRPGRLAVVVADGLSAVAVERHAVPVLDVLLPMLADWRVGPVVVAEQARVAIGDEIGEVLGAVATLLLIGERPGLSSPDSLGAYITWAPRVRRSDAERNCVSNVRPEGLGYDRAARKIAGYLNRAQRLQLTGVALKEESALLED
ncbi:MAG: ethanolamine ammonia-lyase subunit EutC [Silvibacterium sp.]|nr:ethanolamine ammonia-lyase subunit EutC [Silvibacterium sp.]MBV8436752.1 ethanolamine ammonia-lyase subunit EutC [Silvibacterium sp.]